MIESLPKTQPHREVDIEVVAAGEKGIVNSYTASIAYGSYTNALYRLRADIYYFAFDDLRHREYIIGQTRHSEPILYPNS